MPDQYGRLTLAEMRSYILRNLSSYVPNAVDATTGLETGTPELGLNFQFSQQNLNLRINSSTTKASLLVIANNATTLGKEVFYDAVPGVTLYALPPDMAELRGLWWLSSGVDPVKAMPDDYVPMSYQDTMEDGPVINGLNATRPTWRLVGNSIQLNQDPGDYIAALVPQGIWFKYVRWVQFLVNDNDVLQLPFAQVLQEVIVWDATSDLLKTQEEIVDQKGIQETLQYWLAQLELVVRNQYRPPEIRLIGPAIVKTGFSGH